MCGLCGLIEEQSDWTASLSDLPSRQERYRRLKLINALVKSHRIQTPTGKQAIANGLGELWGQIHTLTGRPIDVLDGYFLHALEACP